MNLYLDDWRQPPAGFTVARNFEECILLIDSEDIDCLSLDYHLGELKNGMDVVRHIITSGRWPKCIYLHTSDASARDRMYRLLLNKRPSPAIEVHRGPMPR